MEKMIPKNLSAFPIDYFSIATKTASWLNPHSICI
jgi:hypothetical protein